MLIGHIKELWRYPVKSLGGEPHEQLQLTSKGAVGDRHWAVYDPLAPVIRSAKQWPALLNLRAQYLGTPGPEDWGNDVAPVRLLNAAGGFCDSTDLEACSTWLSRQLNRQAQLRPRAPVSEREFYRLPRPITEAEMAKELGMNIGDALPDFEADYSDLMAEMAGHATPPGYLYDAFPLHLLTTDSLAFVAEKSQLNADVRRFRPNLLMETTDPRPALTEQQWLGASLAIGNTVLRIHSRTVRCSMPGRAQPGFQLEAQQRLPGAVARHADRALGVNLHIVQAGTIQVGDPVQLLA